MPTRSAQSKRGAGGPFRSSVELGEPRFEVLPLSGITEKVVEFLPPDATVTVTASPRQGITATLECTQELARHGVKVVPHMSARLIAHEQELKEVLDNLSDLGVEEIFVVAGDAKQPVGEFESALDLLRAMADLGHDFTVGITGYPETHPLIPDDVAIQAMSDKVPYSSYIVSQMCFDAGALGTWVEQIRSRGIDLPVKIGIPAPITPSKLLRISTQIGVGQSLRVLRHHRGGMRHLAGPGSWSPSDLLEDLDRVFADPAYGLRGLHIYTFNDVATANQWWQQISAASGA